MIEPLIYPIPRVHMHVDHRLQIAVHLVPPTHEIDRCDRGMVGNLLSVNRTTPNVSLVSLPEYWVERFLHIEVDYAITQSKRQHLFESVKMVGTFGDSLQKLRAQTH